MIFHLWGDIIGSWRSVVHTRWAYENPFGEHRDPQSFAALRPRSEALPVRPPVSKTL